MLQRYINTRTNMMLFATHITQNKFYTIQAFTSEYIFLSQTDSAHQPISNMVYTHTLMNTP